MKHTIILSTDLAEEFPFRDLLREVIAAALDAEGVSFSCEVDMLITDDAGMREINREQRNVDMPTDVLSFPMFELTPGVPPADERELDPETGLLPLGDIVISLERAMSQAEEFGHSTQRELAYLAVHSVLHLLGYDHMDEGEQKTQMRGREEAILSRLGMTRELGVDAI